MKIAHKQNFTSKLSLVGLIITLGIVYGDIGTSPLYVMRAIIGGATHVEVDFILGAISCIIWTLTLQTTLKYIIITLKADNKGEGGIFSLYALIRRKVKWVFVFALIGGSTLLADGIITPSITVVSAIEGLKILNPNIPIIPIVLIIITALFIVQQFGTNLLGESFGPIMFIWFLMLALLGLSQIVHFPQIFNSFNPYYAVKLLVQYPGGFFILGAVFLCTTGAEALYLDLGHCGIQNIRISWIYVKICLILNYLGQGAWVLTHQELLVESPNPFFTIMPDWFLVIGIIVATFGAIIASQALISGSYTLISEAIQFNFWPKVKINYPTTIQGQRYIPSINWILWASCVFVVIFFQESSKMEAAYGLSNNITMLMTTVLISFYLYFKRIHWSIISLFISVYLTIEISFLVANLQKFLYGGWFTVMMAGILFIIMFIWFRGRKIKNRFYAYEKMDRYIDVIKDLSKDVEIPKFSSNLVYITQSYSPKEIECKILYSLINKQPKRADVYWFLHVFNVDDPHRMDYKVNAIVPDIIYRVDFYIGFKVEPKINLFFKQVIDDMVKNKEIDVTSRFKSLRKYGIMSDFRFVVIDRIQNYDFDFSAYEQFIMDIYAFMKQLGITDVKAYGLDTSNVTVESVPLISKKEIQMELKRLESKKD
ncbi:MAG: potassium transporter Kup [Bacteroidetes bacterium CG2_30_32_10]|nr:MAG: potassium transporter Kup [Bacteroidetes bacterium CG2_30_32_10]